MYGQLRVASRRAGMFPAKPTFPQLGALYCGFRFNEQLLSRSPEGWASVAPDWSPAPAPQPGGELVGLR